jgi:predicted dehydrogenase
MSIAEDSTAPAAVRVAVVGAGSWADNLAHEFARSADWALVALVDVDRHRLASRSKTGGGAAVVASVDELLADVEIDAVAIAGSSGARHEIALQAISAGKHLVIESPLAINATQGRELVAAAQTTGTVLMTDNPHCHTPAVLAMRELIESGEVGEVLYVDSVRIDLGLGQSNRDVFWDLAPHDLSVLDAVLPGGLRPASVSAQAADPLRAGRPCVGYLSLQWANGCIAHIHVNWLSPTRIRQMVIGGSKGTMIWDDLKPQQRLGVFDRGDTPSGREHGLDAGGFRPGAALSQPWGNQRSPLLPEVEPRSLMIESFAAAIRTQAPVPTDGTSALRVLSILEAAAESLAAGGAKIPLATAGPAGTAATIALEAAW